MKPKCVIKIGGSAFDVLYYDKKKTTVTNITKKIIDLHPKYGFVLTVGGGPFADVVKGYDVEGCYKDLMVTNALKNNCLYLEFLLNGRGQIITPEDFSNIDDELLENKIAIAYHAPIDAPLSDSDTHSLAIAELLAINNLYSYNTLRQKSLLNVHHVHQNPFLKFSHSKNLLLLHILQIY